MAMALAFHLGCGYFQVEQGLKVGSMASVKFPKWNDVHTVN